MFFADDSGGDRPQLPGTTRVSIEPSLKIEDVPSKIIDVRGNEVYDWYHKSNVFFGLIRLCYAFHLVPTFSPDDFWLFILKNLADEVNAHVEYYREFLAGPGGEKRTVVVECDSGTMEELFEKFIKAVSQVSNAGDLVSKLEADFTTTTSLTRMISQVTIADMTKEYFACVMKCTCGFPAIDFTGTLQDWELILTKLNVFRTIARPEIKEYLTRCEAVIKNVCSAFDATKYTPPKWKEFYYNNGYGFGDRQYEGWILDILRTVPGGMWDPDDVPAYRIVYKFQVEHPLTQERTEKIINCGPVGVDRNNRIVYDYFVEDFKGMYRVADKDVEFKDIKWDEFSKISFGGTLLVDLIKEKGYTEFMVVKAEKNFFGLSLPFDIYGPDPEKPEEGICYISFTLSPNMFSIDKCYSTNRSTYDFAVEAKNILYVEGVVFPENNKELIAFSKLSWNKMIPKIEEMIDVAPYKDIVLYMDTYARVLHSDTSIWNEIINMEARKSFGWLIQYRFPPDNLYYIFERACDQNEEMARLLYDKTVTFMESVEYHKDINIKPTQKIPSKSWMMGGYRNTKFESLKSYIKPLC